jgi:ribose/xylose/arabinose/galactoside ABC-type transport system permease subunit
MTTVSEMLSRIASLRKRLPAPLAAAGLWLRRTGIVAQILTLVILVGGFAIGTGGKNLSWANIQVILSLAAIPAILATGLHLTVVLGGIDLSVQGVAALCAVFVGLLVRNKFNSNDVGLWIIPISLGIGGVAGVINGVLHTRLRIPSFITTLGMSWILYGMAVYVNRAVLIPLQDERIQTLINGKIFGVPQIAIFAVVLAVIMQLVQDRTQFGRYIYAIGGDEVLAHQAGVNVGRIKIAAFTIAGILYGLGALLLVCRMGSATSRTGLNLLFPTITAVAVGGVALTGGIGGAKNAVLGALIVTALNNGLVLLAVNPFAQQAVNGVVLITAVALTIDRKKLGFIK